MPEAVRGTLHRDGWAHESDFIVNRLTSVSTARKIVAVPVGLKCDHKRALS